MIYQRSGPSGGKLAWLLKTSVTMPHGNALPPDNPEGRWFCEIERDKNILPVHINYGCSKKHLPKDCINYNSQDVRDKVRCFKIFDLHGIPHPRLITNPALEKKAFLGRKNKSSQGRGIIKYSSKKKTWRNGKSDFFVEFIDAEKEFRVHVFMGQILCEFNKEFGEGHKFIHSSQYGSKMRFGNLDHPEREAMLAASILAIEKTGLHYGAVDLISEKETGKWMVLEVNSAPSMAHEIGFLYAEKFAEYFKIPLKKWWTCTGTGKIIDNRKKKLEKPKNLKYLA